VAWDAAQRGRKWRVGRVGGRRAADRMPRRPTDRFEDLAAWVLVAVALLVLLLAGTVAQAVHQDALARSVTEAGHRHQVDARLVARPIAGTSRYQLGTAAWTAPNGTAHTGRVPISVARPDADGSLKVWVDDAGVLSHPPATAAQAVQAAVVTAIGVALAGIALVAAAWAGVGALVDRWNSARWEREWARVGPRWSRRVH
jgi:hypothetical protein